MYYVSKFLLIKFIESMLESISTVHNGCRQTGFRAGRQAGGLSGGEAVRLSHRQAGFRAGRFSDRQVFGMQAFERACFRAGTQADIRDDRQAGRFSGRQVFGQASVRNAGFRAGRFSVRQVFGIQAFGQAGFQADIKAN